MKICAVDWIGDEEGYLKLIDQTQLPLKLTYLKCRRVEQVARAIKTLQVRGAPAIGVTAAFGAYLGVRSIKAKDMADFYRQYRIIYSTLLATRPTAVNLKWALARIEKVIIGMLLRAPASGRQRGFTSLRATPPIGTSTNIKFVVYQTKLLAMIKRAVYYEAMKILSQDREVCIQIGIKGAKLIKNNSVILTHCNAGLLATAGIGTATAPLYQARKNGKLFSVFVDETRPILQGSRLTVWELQRNHIPVTLICDSMAGSLMAQGKIDLVIVGADRIARNGDTANKIGTYPLAVLAYHHRIPFYVAAPMSTFDNSIRSGKDIPIEYRNPDEVTHIAGKAIAPAHTKVSNPAFDVTPAKYITAFITEKGIIKPRHII